MKRYNWIKKIIKPKFVLFSSAVAIISALLCSLANVFEWNFFPITLILFLVSLSAILTQILVAVCESNEILENMNADKSCILAPACITQAQTELTNLLNDSVVNIRKVLIICYGTSAYGNTITDACHKVNKRNIEYHVMFCAPEKAFKKRDKKTIEAKARDIRGKGNFYVYYSKYPPTIRGCIVYDKKGKPIWNCLQTYYYNENESITANYDNSYAIVGRGGDQFILDNSTEIIEKEFKRLKMH